MGRGSANKIEQILSAEVGQKPVRLAIQTLVAQESDFE